MQRTVLGPSATVAVGRDESDPEPDKRGRFKNWIPEASEFRPTRSSSRF